MLTHHCRVRYYQTVTYISLSGCKLCISACVCRYVSILEYYQLCLWPDLCILITVSDHQVEHVSSTRPASCFKVPRSPYPVYTVIALYMFITAALQICVNSAVYNKVCFNTFHNLSLCANTSFTKHHPLLQVSPNSICHGLFLVLIYYFFLEQASLSSFVPVDFLSLSELIYWNQLDWFEMS